MGGNHLTYSCGEICGFIDTYAPPEYKEEGDNIGLQLGGREQGIDRLFLTLGLTHEVLQEALDFDADMLVVHHSPFYYPYQQLREEDLNTIVLTLIRQKVALFAAHTNLDMAMGGVSDILALRLGLKQITVLQPYSQQMETIGLGRIGILEEAISLEEFARHVSKCLETEGVRFVGQKDQKIQTVACCGGSAAYLQTQALEKGADCYVTADVKYHDGLIAWETGLGLIDAGHYATESPVIPVLAAYLQDKMPDLTIQVSCSRAEPFHYL